MSVPPELAQLAELARRNKVSALRRDPEAAIWHLVEFERDGGRVMRFACCTAEDMYCAVTEGIPALAADAVGLAVDVWTMDVESPTDPRNPVTDKPLRLGDMDEIADLGHVVGDVGEQNLLRECLQFIRVERSGTWQITTLPYENNRKRRRIKWSPPENVDVDSIRKLAAKRGHGMRMVDEIEEAFAKRTAASTLGRAIGDHEKDLVRRFQERRDREFAIGLDSLDGFKLLEGAL